MGRFLFVITLTIFASIQPAFSQHTLSGKILNEKTKVPVEFAVVATPDNSLWAITDNKGDFSISLPSGKNSLIISCLGYVKTTINVEIQGESLSNQTYYVKENNLSLNEVVITAQKKTEEVATSYTIDKNALEHAQMKDVSDILTQLPGGQTSDKTNLTSNQQVTLRSNDKTEIDNPSFGTAIEVDGVRLSNNSTYSKYSDAGDGIEGIDTRSIAVNNIASIEVVTGLPSVEHGDLNSGLLKIHTKKGKSPYEIEIVTKPEIKTYSVNKGFDLGNKRGLLNTSLEHTRSISERISPYTTYVRNSLTMTYRNTFGKENRPIELTYGITGNYGGYDQEADPDVYDNTFKKYKDHILRSHININWLLNKTWLTGLNFTGSVNYSNREKKIQEKKSSSSFGTANHATEEGYFISQPYDENPDAMVTLIDRGHWYELQLEDDKPIEYSAKLKADWIRKFGEVHNKIKIGGEITYSGNYGKGEYYDNMRYAPDWRAYRYDKQPFVKTFSYYAEDKVKFPVAGNELQLQAGIRSDITSIKESEYGTVQSFSPRINAQYSFLKGNHHFIRNASVHAGWGDATKLPSSHILYPRPQYIDERIFGISTQNDESAVYASYTMPMQLLYNPDLKWQRNRKAEIGMDIQLGKTKFSLTIFRDKTFHPYQKINKYTTYSYNYTTNDALDNCEIPIENRAYNVDQATGIITVSDVTGTLSSRELVYSTKNAFKATPLYTNGDPVIRKGMEWIVDFGKIPSLKTSVRLDGNYYYYKGINQTIEGKSISTNMSDGNQYKYIGYFVGNDKDGNGSETKKIKTNVTFTTHIPVIRLIVSLRIESCLYDYTQKLSEYSGGRRSYIVDPNDSNLPLENGGSIYDGNHYVITYPLYYTSWEDMNTKVPFLETFLWAKENDPTLYNQLTKLIITSSKDYDFKKQKYSAYFSGNINVTKEIGDKISISFQATNFFNNLGQIKDSQTGNKVSLDRFPGFPKFYYGLSMRIKL